MNKQEKKQNNCEKHLKSLSPYTVNSDGELCIKAEYVYDPEYEKAWAEYIAENEKRRNDG